MDTTTVVVDETPTIEPRPFPFRHGPSRYQRDALLAGKMVYDRPPDAGNPGKTTPGTIRALTARQHALEEARKRGAEPRGVGRAWESDTRYESGDRVVPPDRGKGHGSFAYLCLEAGHSAELEPAWLKAKNVEGVTVVRDGTVVWARQKRWTGRMGYGGMGMRELCDAMRMPPMFLNEKERNAARRARDSRTANAPVPHVPAHKRQARAMDARHDERMTVRRAVKLAMKAAKAALKEAA